MSILAYAGYGSDVSFYDCTWGNNTGKYRAAINTWHKGDTWSMKITLSTIYNQAGIAILEECKFLGNSDGALHIASAQC